MERGKGGGGREGGRYGRNGKRRFRVRNRKKEEERERGREREVTCTCTCLHLDSTTVLLKSTVSEKKS